jgi:hypothetical protein
MKVNAIIEPSVWIESEQKPMLVKGYDGARGRWWVCCGARVS